MISIKSHQFLWTLLVLMFLVFITYSNGLFNEFVSDDKGIIINMNSWTIKEILRSSISSFRIFQYVIIHFFVEFEPVYYRILNVLIHLGNVLLIFLIGKKVFNNGVALLASSLFAVHPLLSESVVWVSGGLYAQYSLFFLLSLIFYIYADKNYKFYLYSIIFYCVSLLASEKAISLFLLFPFYELAYKNYHIQWKRTILYCGISIIYVVLFLLSGRLQSRLQFVEHQDQGSILYTNPFIQIPISLSSYVQLFIWPDRLTIYQSEQSYSLLSYGTRTFLVALYFVAIFRFFKKDKHLFFWFIFFLIPLIPTLTPLGISWIVAERYAYLSIVGLVFITAYCYEKIIRRSKTKILLIGIWILLLIGYATRTIIRNYDWKNEDTLWLATAKTSPSSAQNHNNLGDYYGRHKDYPNSIKSFQRAIELKPSYADAYHNLGNAYRDSGDIHLAIESYEKAYSIVPSLWQSYQNIAEIYFIQGKYPEAQQYLKKGLEANPNNTNLLLNLGVMYAKMGETEKSKESFLKVLSIDPKNTLSKQALMQLESGGIK